MEQPKAFPKYICVYIIRSHAFIENNGRKQDHTMKVGEKSPSIKLIINHHGFA